ncbi:MAG: DUF2493 domain-containing protein [Ruminococcaceae bacterium]|nr:DUF2493 domain-containing protein [Oscillospiraceae bacterium]
MRVAVVGSRALQIDDWENYLPPDTDEIISGGAKGIDQSVANFARSNGIALKEFLPEYDKYGKRAPLLRNISIIEKADLVLAFWDGKSRGTKFVIDTCRTRNIPIRVILLTETKRVTTR